MLPHRRMKWSSERHINRNYLPGSCSTIQSSRLEPLPPMLTTSTSDPRHAPHLLLLRCRSASTSWELLILWEALRRFPFPHLVEISHLPPCRTAYSKNSLACNNHCLSEELSTWIPGMRSLSVIPPCSGGQRAPSARILPYKGSG